MSEKKNIERLFQEKFKDFEVEPSEKVWATIESKLTQKKKSRKVIPFWWKLSGIAAALIIGFFITDAALNSESDSNHNVVIDENGSEENPNLNSIKNNEIVTSSEVSQSKKEQEENSNNTEKSVLSNSILTAHQSNLKEKNSSKNNSNTITNRAFVFNTKTTNSVNNTALNPFQNKNDIESITVNPIGSSINPINKDNLTVTKIDTNAIAVATPNALEELQKEKNKKSEIPQEKSKVNRWQITSNAAPVYFNSASNGSPLDPQFKNNNKDYKTNLSYGLGVKYALNKKFSVKTGVNAVALEYNTNDVSFYQDRNATRIQNINSNFRGSIIQFQHQNSFAGGDSNGFDGKLNQKMGYIEVPLELSYKIIDRKFGIEVIGGISTLFLNENKISLISSGLEMNIGEANNLSSIHYSTNIGMGFKYRFLKSIQANVEPMLKYQMNTFSSDSGNFKPYFFGIYTGVSYVF